SFQSKNIRAEGNLIRNATGFNLPSTGVIVGASGSDTVWFVNNDVTNFSQTGAMVAGSTGTAIIDHNSFYYDAATPSTGSRHVIDLNSSTIRGLIINNFIGGTATNCGG